jgi:hypothetical protein
MARSSSRSVGPASFASRKSDLEVHLRARTVPCRAEPLEQPYRFLVLGEHDAREACDTLGARPFGELLEQRRAEAEALPAVAHHDRGFRSLARHTHEPRDAGAGAAGCVDRQARLVVVVVHIGQVLELPVVELAHGREEAAVARLLAELGEPGEQERRVAAFDRPDGDARAIGQPNVRADTFTAESHDRSLGGASRQARRGAARRGAARRPPPSVRRASWGRGRRRRVGG